MISVASGSNGIGDLATWLGTLGTWSVGVLAAIIAAIQYRNSIFRPRTVSYIQSDGLRIALRVINMGGAAGMVERVELVTDDDDAPLVDYGWDGWDGCDPVPFILPGKASAILLLALNRPAEAELRMIVSYGNGTGFRTDHLAAGKGRYFRSDRVAA
jgi:hypothetical protein